MNNTENLKSEAVINTNQLRHLKFEQGEREHVVTLVDNGGYEILKGYGETILDAVNDLHSNLI